MNLLLSQVVQRFTRVFATKPIEIRRRQSIEVKFNFAVNHIQIRFLFRQMRQSIAFDSSNIHWIRCALLIRTWNCTYCREIQRLSSGIFTVGRNKLAYPCVERALLIRPLIKFRLCIFHLIRENNVRITEREIHCSHDAFAYTSVQASLTELGRIPSGRHSTTHLHNIRTHER